MDAASSCNVFSEFDYRFYEFDSFLLLFVQLYGLIVLFVQLYGLILVVSRWAKLNNIFCSTYLLSLLQHIRSLVWINCFVFSMYFIVIAPVFEVAIA